MMTMFWFAYALFAVYAERLGVPVGPWTMGLFLVNVMGFGGAVAALCVVLARRWGPRPTTPTVVTEAQ